VRCASAGAERREGGLCAGPAYVVIPQEEIFFCRLEKHLSIFLVQKSIRALLSSKIFGRSCRGKASHFSKSTGPFPN
jgi:hypothetical protein